MSPLRDALRDLPDEVFFDLLESEEGYVVVIDVPGVSAETVDVDVADGTLSIEARREKDVPGEFRYIEENRPLFFDASVPLPREAAGADDAEVTVTHGVLEAFVPKADGPDEPAGDERDTPERERE